MEIFEKAKQYWWSYVVVGILLLIGVVSLSRAIESTSLFFLLLTIILVMIAIAFIYTGLGLLRDKRKASSEQK